MDSLDTDADLKMRVSYCIEMKPHLQRFFFKTEEFDEGILSQEFEEVPIVLLRRTGSPLMTEIHFGNIVHTLALDPMDSVCDVRVIYLFRNSF
jgi:hypothetical protein